MEYITLKNTDLQVSRVCMGGCPMGGHGWGNVQEQELLDAVNAALDNGINFFDTAIAYLEEPYVPHALVGVMAQNVPTAP